MAKSIAITEKNRCFYSAICSHFFGYLFPELRYIVPSSSELCSLFFGLFFITIYYACSHFFGSGLFPFLRLSVFPELRFDIIWLQFNVEANNCSLIFIKLIRTNIICFNKVIQDQRDLLVDFRLSFSPLGVVCVVLFFESDSAK